MVWIICRRVRSNVRKKGHFALHTHDIDDAVDTALTWKGPDLGSDRRERVATSTWSRRGPAPAQVAAGRREQGHRADPADNM
jgi:hypothetical protein